MVVPVVRSQALERRARAILRRLPAGRPLMAEIGVNKGDLGRYLLEHRTDLTWHGVDSWLAEDMQPGAYRATMDMHAHLTRENQLERKERAIANTVGQFGARASVHHMISVAGALLFEDGALDLVFLDGDHSLEGVQRDIAAWWPKVKPGGWLGGHDYDGDGTKDGTKIPSNPKYNFKGVKLAVDTWAERERLPVEFDEGKTWWARRAGD